jgi:hypothetical protein
MPKYVPVPSPFGLHGLHRCVAVDRGPEWAGRERLLSPGRTRTKWSGRKDLDLRPPGPEPEQQES